MMPFVGCMRGLRQSSARPASDKRRSWSITYNLCAVGTVGFADGKDYTVRYPDRDFGERRLERKEERSCMSIGGLLPGMFARRTDEVARRGAGIYQRAARVAHRAE